MSRVALTDLVHADCLVCGRQQIISPDVYRDIPVVNGLKQVYCGWCHVGNIIAERKFF